MARAVSWVHSLLRLFARGGWIVLVAVAGAFGSPVPRPPKHEDAVVMVAGAETERE